MGTRVYIGGLPYRVKERDIERFFRGYGKLREVLIKNGYGFVEFEDYRDADDAVYELNGKELCGERVSIEHARGSGRRGQERGDRGDRGGHDRGHDRGHSGSGGSRRSQWSDNPPPRYGPPTRTDYRLVVENLSTRVSWQDLKDYMRQAGEVTYADAHKQHRNEGVVEFASYSDLKTAIEKLDNTDLNGRRIKLVEDKDARRGSRRRSRSRSSSRSRSRSRSRRRTRSRSRSRSGSKSRSRSRSRGRSKSKSRTPRKSRSKSRSSTRGDRDRSKSRDKSNDRDRSKSRDKSVERDRVRDSRDRDASKSRSRSKSVAKSDHRSRSRSKSRSKSRDKSRSRSHSRSVSRSRSASPTSRPEETDVKMENGDRSSPENESRDD